MYVHSYTHFVIVVCSALCSLPIILAGVSGNRLLEAGCKRKGVFVPTKFSCNEMIGKRSASRQDTKAPNEAWLSGGGCIYVYIYIYVLVIFIVHFSCQEYNISHFYIVGPGTG